MVEEKAGTEHPEGYVPAATEEEELRLLSKEQLVATPREKEITVAEPKGKVKIRALKPSEYAQILDKLKIRGGADYTLGKLYLLGMEVCRKGIVEPKLEDGEDLLPNLSNEIAGKILEWSYLVTPAGKGKAPELDFIR